MSRQLHEREINFNLVKKKKKKHLIWGSVSYGAVVPIMYALRRQHALKLGILVTTVPLNRKVSTTPPLVSFLGQKPEPLKHWQRESSWFDKVQKATVFQFSGHILLE